MRSFLSFLIPFVLGTMITGCGSSNANPVVSIEFRSVLIENGELPIPKGKSVPVKIVGRDAAGNETDLDLGALQWKMTDESNTLVEVKPLGNAFLVTGLRDWFEWPLPNEPSSTVTVSYGTTSATVTARVIVNVTGTWSVSVDDRVSKEIKLSQQGRGVILYNGTTAEIKGRIDKVAISLDYQGITLNGSFSSQTSARGAYTDATGTRGTWSAKKQP